MILLKITLKLASNFPPLIRQFMVLDTALKLSSNGKLLDDLEIDLKLSSNGKLLDNRTSPKLLSKHLPELFRHYNTQ